MIKITLMPQPQFELPPLPLAEQLDESQFLARAEVLAQGGKSNRPVRLFEAACNKVEYGIAVGEVEHADKGFAEMRQIAELPKVAVHHRRPFGTIHTMLAYQAAVRHRILYPGPASLEVFEQTQVELAGVQRTIEDARETMPMEEYQEDLTRLIVLGGLLREKEPSRLPYPATPREDHSQSDAQGNHDIYVLRWLVRKKPEKLAVQLSSKAGTLAEKCANTGISPTINCLSVVPFLIGAIRKHPAINDALKLEVSSLPAERKSGVFLSYIGRLIAQDATNISIGSHEKSILNQLTSNFTSTLTAGSKNEAQARKAALSPLTNSLADQLTKFKDLQS